MSGASAKIIAERFGRAVDTYDEAASVQARIARTLVQKAIRKTNKTPAAILDIGCGTGFVASEIVREWPWTTITAIDNSSAMLAEAQRKIPHMRTIKADMEAREFGPVFDLVLSSMALHWLNNPRAALERWRGWLKPGGRIFAALPVAESFSEWRKLCADEGSADSLWPLPQPDFANGIVAETEIDNLIIEYPLARDFLRRIKATGAATPRTGHRPVAAGAMRRMLARASQPFTVTYRILYMEIQSPGSI